MKVTILQRDIEWANPTLNVQRAEEAIDRNAGADLYVLPEMFSTGFCTQPEGIAESSDSDTLKWMQRKAAQIDAAIAGSVALFVMMLPLIIRSTEETLKILPISLKEAGLALGGNEARVMLRVQLPAAFGGVFTGVLLAISRVIGETAPLMFTALGCSMIRFS